MEWGLLSEVPPQRALMHRWEVAVILAGDASNN